MKIEQNYENVMDAWMMVASALDIIKKLFLDNTSNKKAEDAYYELLTEVNRWNREIKEMPF